MTCAAARCQSADPAAVLRRLVDAAADLAGAEGRPDRLARALRIGQNPDLALARNDSHGVLAAPGDQVVTAPTLTAATDVRAPLIHPARTRRHPRKRGGESAAPGARPEPADPETSEFIFS